MPSSFRFVHLMPIRGTNYHFNEKINCLFCCCQFFFLDTHPNPQADPDSEDDDVDSCHSGSGPNLDTGPRQSSYDMDSIIGVINGAQQAIQALSGFRVNGSLIECSPTKKNSATKSGRSFRPNRKNIRNMGKEVNIPSKGGTKCHKVLSQDSPNMESAANVRADTNQISSIANEVKDAGISFDVTGNAFSHAASDNSQSLSEQSNPILFDQSNTPMDTVPCIQKAYRTDSFSRNSKEDLYADTISETFSNANSLGDYRKINSADAIDHTGRFEAQTDSCGSGDHVTVKMEPFASSPPPTDLNTPATLSMKRVSPFLLKIYTPN